MFYVLNAFEDRNPAIQQRHPYLLTIFLIFPVTFLSIAVVINLRNW